MNKEELFQELLAKIAVGEITREDVLSRLNFPVATQTASTVTHEVKVKPPSNFSVTKLLYVLGAIIAVVGSVLFAYQIWPDIGSFARVSITLGFGLLMTGIGSFLSKNRTGDNTLGTVFHFIGGLLIPGGALVTLHEFTTGTDLAWPLVITFGLIFGFYLLINTIHKNAILTFFTIANGTAFIYLTVNAITNDLYRNYGDLYEYLTMVIGACYILLAYSFRDGWNKKLMPALYFFGFAGIQCAVLAQYGSTWGWRGDSLWPVTISLGLVFAFYLILNFRVKHAGLTFLTILNGTAFIYVLVGALIGGSYYSNADIYTYLTMVIGAVYMLLSHSFRDTENGRLTGVLDFFGILGLLGASFSQIYGSLPWQLFFIILVIGGFTFSIYAKSRIVLVISTLFLLSYVSYITGEYFADSVGWPISLVVLGFIFIGLGYVSININKKYIKN